MATHGVDGNVRPVGQPGRRDRRDSPHTTCHLVRGSCSQLPGKTCTLFAGIEKITLSVNTNRANKGSPANIVTFPTSSRYSTLTMHTLVRQLQIGNANSHFILY